MSKLMPRFALGGVAVALVAGLFLMGAAPQDQISGKAPNFSAKASDGNTHSLASLTKDKTLVLYFIGSTCPINNQAAKHYNALAKAYKGKVNFVGVINTDEKGFADWKSRHNPDYPVLFDPNMTIIRAYKAERSPWVTVVGKNQNVEYVKRGYSTGSLSALGDMMAKAGGVPAAKLTFDGAPAADRFG